MATQPPPETPAPAQPGQPTQPPPEIVPPAPDIDQPDPGPAQTPGTAPGQPID
ncbi:hypothetical protein [Sphingosinicella sp. YJ22]|uniref:hypothetical protein n=1 Tax=Sphingosinicella sp. YJ22 TaxID=1104780 RepID=UPI00140A5F7A|nr:hypothetical protein [Sphingosinicella sp. YJ22]